MVLTLKAMPNCHGGSSISSNQSSMEWKIIAARIKWNCARISEILKEISQEEEHPELEMAEAEIQIQEANSARIHKPESEAKAKTTAITNSQQQQNFSTKKQIQKTPITNQVSKLISNKKSDLHHQSTLQIEEIIEKEKQPNIIVAVLHTKNDGGDEDRRAVGVVSNADGWGSSGTEIGTFAKGKGKTVAIAEMTNAFPPDLRSDANDSNDTTIVTHTSMAGVEGGVHGSDTDVDAFGKRKVESQEALGTETSNRHLHHDEKGAGGEVHLVPSIFATPPGLLAAMFPWDRKSEIHTQKALAMEDTTVEEEADATRLVGDELKVMKNHSAAMGVPLLTVEGATMTAERRRVIAAKTLVAIGGGVRQLLPPSWGRDGLPQILREAKSQMMEEGMKGGLQTRSKLLLPGFIVLGQAQCGNEDRLLHMASNQIRIGNKISTMQGCLCWNKVPRLENKKKLELSFKQWDPGGIILLVVLLYLCALE